MAKNSYFNENTLDELLEEIKYVYQSDKRPWVIGYSGGKDSTTVVELVYKMLLSLNENERNKNVYIVSSDTLIENPLIKIYLSKMNEALGKAATRDGLPIKSAMVTPKAKNSFWANVIGRGYPTPRMNGSFRWCTDKLKINPSAEYIKEIIKEESEEVVVLLGVRKAESIARKRRIEGRELANRLLNRHETIQDAYVYNPIVELTTEDVWDVLLRLDGGKTPWGTDNSELVSLYADADSGECPFAGIHAGGQTQSCGNSRFGCWVCTVVKEDKSLNGFIRSGHRELIPLAEFRKWLMSIRDIPEYREKKKRNGSIYKDKDGNIGYALYNEEGKICAEISLPGKYRKYIATICNYIILEKEINSNLKNRPVYEKIEMLEREIKEKGIDFVIPSKRSQFHFYQIKEYLHDKCHYPKEKLDNSKTKGEKELLLKNYYTKYFEEEFLELARTMDNVETIYVFKTREKLMELGFTLDDDTLKYSIENGLNDVIAEINPKEKNITLSVEVYNPYYGINQTDIDSKHKYNEIIEMVKSIFFDKFKNCPEIHSSNEYGGSDDESITFSYDLKMHKNNVSKFIDAVIKANDLINT